MANTSEGLGSVFKQVSWGVFAVRLFLSAFAAGGTAYVVAFFVTDYVAAAHVNGLSVAVEATNQSVDRGLQANATRYDDLKSFQETRFTEVLASINSSNEKLDVLLEKFGGLQGETKLNSALIAALQADIDQIRNVSFQIGDQLNASPEVKAKAWAETFDALVKTNGSIVPPSSTGVKWNGSSPLFFQLSDETIRSMLGTDAQKMLSPKDVGVSVEFGSE